MARQSVEHDGVNVGGIGTCMIGRCISEDVVTAFYGPLSTDPDFW